jgi:hypothetical protein
VERKDEGHVDWRSSKRGDANVDAAKSRERGDFMMSIGFALDVKFNGHGIEAIDKYIWICYTATEDDVGLHMIRRLHNAM